jgi:hypothetical protein
MWHRSNGPNGIAKQWTASDPDPKFWMMRVSKKRWWDGIRFNFRLFCEQITLESGKMRFEGRKSFGTGNKLRDEFSPREGWRWIWVKEISSRFAVWLSFDLSLWKFIYLVSFVDLSCFWDWHDLLHLWYAPFIRYLEYDCATSFR